MSGFGMDGSRGFASELWAMLNDGGTWAVPRSGLMYRKDEANKRMVLFMRMPWFPGLSVTPEQLIELQEDDVQGIKDMFASIRVDVVEPTL